MRNTVNNTILAIFGLLFIGCQTPDRKTIKVVFVTGDEEYRSEESMPMLGKILERELGASVHYCFAVDSNGYINPNQLDHIKGLEKLKDADLMVMFTRFRALPSEELSYITDYVESGKPIVGFRTSTHAFLYKDDSTKFHMNNEWPQEVFGQQWITHHGNHYHGEAPVTSVSILQEKESHPILNGVDPFEAYSWLYHVDGGDWKLSGDSDPLLLGTALKSNHEENDRLDKFPLTNPVSWTKTYRTTSGDNARVFFTTLGHPYDFKKEPMRKLSIQGIFWALGKESEIPKNGINVDIEGDYNPNNAGFGNKFKSGRRPL